MFARLSAAILLALPLFALADDSGNCFTGEETCCNSVHDVRTPINLRFAVHPDCSYISVLLAKSANVARLLGVAPQGVTGQVGLTCSHVSALAIQGTSCNQQTVCYS